MASPTGCIDASEHAGTWFGPPNPTLEDAASRGVLHALAAIEHQAAAVETESGHPPFAGWIMCLHYELGHVLEPAAGLREPRADTVAHFLWCTDGWVHDGQTNQWWAMGDPPTLGDPREEFLQRTGPTVSSPTAIEWPQKVARAIEYIHAGDIFQVNMSRQLQLPVSGSPRGFARAALNEPQSSFGACLELPGRDCTIVSLSPELFLHADASGLITTRPIKGTLPADQPAESLRNSDKDAAELHMIVDLMRNDLGRVCKPGSVHVTCPRRIESHQTVHHGVAEVQGQLCDGTSLADVLKATFPAGSITGAPKIRAMQIANELESIPRGPYCGAIGMLGPRGQVSLSVAIRTAIIAEGVLEYAVGCGVVADSDPLAELAESEAKAAVLWTAMENASPPGEVPSAAAASPQLHA